MKQRYEIILAGSGGQGLVVAGKLLGEAAILDGNNVVQTQTYGIAQRGGLSSAEVIVDQEEIIYQQVRHADMIIALNELAIRKYTNPLLGFPVIYDSGVLQTRRAQHLYGLPLTAIAAENGNSAMANLVAIGAMLALNPAVSYDSFVNAIQSRFTPAVAVRNIQAVISGMKAAEEIMKGGK